MRKVRILLIAGLAALAVGAYSGNALAVGTAAGTSILNSASVSFNVGGQVQPAVAGTISFTVDNRVDLTATANDAPPVYVNLGATNQVLTFTVANTGNATQDYSLSAVASLPAYLSLVGIFVDGNGNGTYDAGVDTATYIDEMAADATTTVFIVADIIGTPADSTDVVVTLTATTADGGSAGVQGGSTSETAGPNTAGVDVVFGDAAGATDAAVDGLFSASNTVRIRNAVLTVTKAVIVTWDPFNLAVDPKAIPGAILQYTITVTNAGGAAALNAVLTDAIPGGTTFVPGSLTLNGVAQPDPAGAISVTLTTPLVSGASDVVVFQVTVN